VIASVVLGVAMTLLIHNYKYNLNVHRRPCCRRCHGDDVTEYCMKFTERRLR